MRSLGGALMPCLGVMAVLVDTWSRHWSGISNSARELVRAYSSSTSVTIQLKYGKYSTQGAHWDRYARACHKPQLCLFCTPQNSTTRKLPNCTVHCTVYSTLCALYRVPCTVCPVPCALYPYPGHCTITGLSSRCSRIAKI